MRGFLGGFVVGVAVFLAVMAGLSLVKPLVEAPEVSATAPSPEETGSDLSPETDASALATTGRDADLVEVAPTVPSDEGVQPEPTAPAEMADTAPAGKPQVAEDAAGLAGPAQTPSAHGIDVTTEPPVAPVAPTIEPPEPAEADTPAVAEVEPARPAPPAPTETAPSLQGEVEAEEQAPSLPAATQTEPRVEIATTPTTEPDSEAQPQTAPQSAVIPEAATEPAATHPPAGAEPLPSAGSVAETITEPAAPDGLGVQDAPEAAPRAETDPGAAPAPTAPRIAALPQAGTQPDQARPRIGTPARPLTERDEQPEAAAETGTADDEAAPALPPLQAFAMPFDNPDNKPLMSIVLIDDAESIGAEALADFPYPLTFAVDATLPDATERMARHRANGFEVVALVQLAPDARPTDAETALAAALAKLPQAVAILEDPDKSLQRDRAVSDQVSAIVRQTGHGLILQNNGLNTAQKLAARAGVPSAVVFRDFDGAGQTPTVMRRFLDQAAFRARRDGAVIMVGRVRPDTISALLLWGLQDRANRVALAPVSAVLLQGRAEN